MCHILHPASMLITHEQMVLHFCAPITETKIIFTYTKTEAWFWVLGWFLSILTIIGNGLYIIFLVYNKRRLRKKTNAFVVSLAEADLCVGISVFPLLFLYEITRARGYSRSLQKGMLIVRWLFQDASVVCLCSLVLERYIAIVKAYICPNDFRHMENNCYFYFS